MTTTSKVKIPNTLSHTREILKKTLEPHSLEELFELVEGKFPFRAVKVINVNSIHPDGGVFSNIISVGETIQVIGRDEKPWMLRRKGGELRRVLTTSKQWRLAE